MEITKEWFAGKYAVSAGGCWLWLGNVDTDGYGSVSFGPRDDHKTVRVHRAAYEAFVRPLPPLHTSLGYHGWCVCHVCDVRLCMNPDHLFIAPQAAKGRTPSRSKLSDEQVSAIKRDYAAGMRQRELAAKHGVSQGYISMLVNADRRWHHDGDLGLGMRSPDKG